MIERDLLQQAYQTHQTAHPPRSKPGPARWQIEPQIQPSSSRGGLHCDRLSEYGRSDLRPPRRRYDRLRKDGPARLFVGWRAEETSLLRGWSLRDFAWMGLEFLDFRL